MNKKISEIFAWEKFWTTIWIFYTYLGFVQSDGRLAPVLAQEWGPALVFMASPEEQTGEMISGNSLVGTHLMAATLRLANIHKNNNLMSVFFFVLLLNMITIQNSNTLARNLSHYNTQTLTARFLSFYISLLQIKYLYFGQLK